MMTLNHDTRRKIRKSIGKDACVLAAAVAERSRSHPAIFEMACYEKSGIERKRYKEELRQWIADFEAGEIVYDEEASDK